MEKLSTSILQSLPVGTVVYVRTSDVVTCKKVVQEQIILDGSAASLTAQIVAAKNRINELSMRGTGYYEDLVARAREETEREIAEAQPILDGLVALWREATGKEYPEK